MSEIDRLRAELAEHKKSVGWHQTEHWKLKAELAEAKARIAELEGGKAGWEVEGFIDRLTRRDDSNSERLVLEAISHLRGFSRDCDGLRARAERTEARIGELEAELSRDGDQIVKAFRERYDRAERAEAELKAMRELLDWIYGFLAYVDSYHSRIIRDKIRAALAPSPAGREG